MLTYVMVEKTPRAFNLRLVRNDDVLEDIRDQGALDRLLVNIDELYTDFRRVLFFSSHCGYCSLRASNKTLNMVGIFFPAAAQEESFNGNHFPGQAPKPNDGQAGRARQPTFPALAYRDLRLLGSG